MSDSCEWCEGEGCDECQSTLISPPHPAPTPVPITAPVVECEWCDSTGCDECADQREAALLKAPQVTQTTPPMNIKTDCEWCEGQGCDECHDQLLQLQTAAQSNVPIQSVQMSTTTASAPIVLDTYYHDDSDDDAYNNQHDEDDIPTKIVNLYYSAQYLQPQHQLLNFNQIENFVINDFISFDMCTSEAINALIHSITRLSVIRFKLHHSTNDLVKTFELCLSLHKKASFPDVLSSAVSEILQICTQYDLALQNNTDSNTFITPDGEDCTTFTAWAPFFSDLLMKHRTTFPVIFFPVMRIKLSALSSDFYSIYGTFSGTMSQQDREKSLYPILMECNSLLELCLDSKSSSISSRKVPSNTTPSSSPFLAPMTMTMAMDDHLPPPSDDLFGLLPSTFGFQTHISQTIHKHPHITPNPFNQSSISNPYLQQRDLSFLLNIPPTYSSVVLEILSLQGCVYYDLDLEELVESLLPIISRFLHFAPFSTLPMHVTARIYNLFAYFSMTNQLWQQAYIFYSQSFTSCANTHTPNAKNDAILSLSFTALCTLLVSSISPTSTSSIVNPLLTLEAQPYLTSTHIGLGGVVTLFNAFINADLAAASMGLAQWVDYCTMFHLLPGLRLASKLRDALVQVALKRYSLSYDNITLRSVLSQFSSINITKSSQMKAILDEYGGYDANYLIDISFAQTHSSSSRIVAQSILSNAFLAQIDDITSSLTFIQKQPLPVLLTQSEKDIEDRSNLEFFAFSTMVLDNAFATFSSLPLPGIPLTPYTLYYTHGGMVTSNDIIFPFAVPWKKVHESFVSSSTEQYFYRYIFNYFHTMQSNFTTNTTPINSSFSPTKFLFPTNFILDETNNTHNVWSTDLTSKTKFMDHNNPLPQTLIYPNESIQSSSAVFNLTCTQLSSHVHTMLQTLVQMNLSLHTTLKDSATISHSTIWRLPSTSLIANFVAQQFFYHYHQSKIESGSITSSHSVPNIFHMSGVDNRRMGASTSGISTGGNTGGNTGGKRVPTNAIFSLPGTPFNNQQPQFPPNNSNNPGTGPNNGNRKR